MKLKIAAFLILLFIQVSVSAEIAERSVEITNVDISIDNGGFVSIEEKVIVKGVNNITLLIPRDVEVVSVYSDGDVLEYELRDYEMVINATGVAGNGTNISSEVIEVSRITIFFPELTRKSGNITLKYGSSRFTSKIYRTWTFSILIPTTAYKTAIRMRFPKGTLFTSLPMNIRVGFEENTLILASESYIFGFACKYEIISPGPEVDNEPPLITLQSPSNNSVMLEGTVIFRYNVEDEKSGISSCRLIVDGVVEQVNNSIKKEGMNQFTYMVKGESFWNDYEWSIECIDDSMLHS